MEHRWGRRIDVNIPVRIYSQAYAVKHGFLCNLSVSGGFIASGADFRPLSQIHVRIDLPNLPKHEAPTVDGYVARRYKAGVGVEWSEFGPAAITRLLQTLAAQRVGHLRRPAPQTALVVARLSAPLLKHGT